MYYSSISEPITTARKLGYADWRWDRGQSHPNFVVGNFRLLVKRVREDYVIKQKVIELRLPLRSLAWVSWKEMHKEKGEFQEGQISNLMTCSDQLVIGCLKTAVSLD